MVTGSPLSLCASAGACGFAQTAAHALLLHVSCRFWSWNDQGGGAVLGWRVLLAMAQSMVPGQQAASWEALKALPIDASDGFALCGTIGRLTRTAAKWWIATRPA